MFEDLELPDIERKRLRQIEIEAPVPSERVRRKGIRVRLDKKRTARSRVKRKKASIKHHPGFTPPARFPFTKTICATIIRSRTRNESNAVVLCIMDTSGSMDTMKNIWRAVSSSSLSVSLHALSKRRDLLHRASHEAHEVTEEEFFHKGESAALLSRLVTTRALEIIEAVTPDLMEVYVFHCSDGETSSRTMKPR